MTTINYNANAIIEAEVVNGKETLIVACGKCGDAWQLEDGDVCVEPWPHFQCPHCGEWISLF